MMSALFPPPGERRRQDDALTVALAAAEARVWHGPVTPDFDRAAFATELAAFRFDTPRPLDTLCDWTIEQMEHGVVHLTHPRYLGLFNPAPSYPAQCADRIAASFNPQLATATTSPAAVAIEAHVIAALAERAGLPAGSTGHFTSGGSEANGAALTCALVRAEPAFASEGSRAFAGRPTFYISADSHLAWIKLAVMAGIGRSAARIVPTGPDGRMDPSALRAMIAADREGGAAPVMVVATAGTTNAGMIDPLDACAAIAAEAGAWFHVDAAWGGGLLASERLRGALRGIERADSIIIDAHKWFATTMGCGVFLTAHPEVVTAAFDVRTSFMPSHAAADPYVSSAQWSRRFAGLRLFLSLGAAGWAGHGEHVERGIALGRLLAESMRGRGWSVANDPAMAVVCLCPPSRARSVREIVATILASGAAWLSVATFAGKEVVRACITHGGTDDADVAAVAEALVRAAEP